MPTLQSRAELWRFPLSGPTGGSGLTKVDLIFVSVESSDGFSGLGFSYLLGGDGRPALALVRSLLADFIDGRELRRPETLWRAIKESFNRTGRGLGYVALAAIDLALWDLEGHRRNAPLGELLGGERRSVRLYGSGGFAATQDSEGAVSQALTFQNLGHTAVKLRAAGNGADLARIAAVRDAAPSLSIMVDLNEKADLATALWFSQRCAELGVVWIEEPIPASLGRGYEKLAASSPVAIAFGEHLQGVEDLPDLKAGSALAVFQPDLAMMGGVTECMRATTLVAHSGLSVAPHFLPDLFVHLAAASPTVSWLEEFQLLEPLFESAADRSKPGEIQMGDAPGHGLRFRPEAREAFSILD